jgi:hypothetical protein
VTETLERDGMSIQRRDESAIEYTWRGVQVVATSASAALAGTLRQEIDRFQPDRIVVTSEDVLSQLLRTAVACGGERVTYLANTTTTLPVGPDSFTGGLGGGAAPLSGVLARSHPACTSRVTSRPGQGVRRRLFVLRCSVMDRFRDMAEAMAIC